MVAGVTLEPGRPTHVAALQRDNLLQELAEQKLAIAEESVLLATSEAYDLSIGEDPKSADDARAFAQSTSLPSVRTELAESGSTVDASCIGFDVCVNRLASPNRPFK